MLPQAVPKHRSRLPPNNEYDRNHSWGTIHQCALPTFLHLLYLACDRMEIPVVHACFFFGVLYFAVVVYAWIMRGCRME